MTETVEGRQDWSSEHARRWRALGDELRRRLGPGAPLEAHVRGQFEGRLGGDVSGAMIHRSPLAGHLARTLGAQAVTAGSHILGDAADLDPTTTAGAALLGHELTHVVDRDVSAAGEVAAQAAERTFMAGAAATPTRMPAGDLELEELTDRVYGMLLDELRYDQERARW